MNNYYQKYVPFSYHVSIEKLDQYWDDLLIKFGYNKDTHLYSLPKDILNLMYNIIADRIDRNQMENMNKVLCECGKIATWLYMPSEVNRACCDDCVPRGCSCNQWDIRDGGWPEGIEGKDYEWINDKLFEDLHDGKKLPCCEWSYEEEGWEDE